jgi:7-cyano-7-deazaguanine synthase
MLAELYGPEKVYALSFHYGQRQSHELSCARKTCEYLRIRHKVLDLGVLGEIAKPMSANIAGTALEMPTIKDVLGDPQPKTYVPFRQHDSFVAGPVLC